MSATPPSSSSNQGRGDKIILSEASLRIGIDLLSRQVDGLVVEVRGLRSLVEGQAGVLRSVEALADDLRGTLHGSDPLGKGALVHTTLGVQAQVDSMPALIDAKIEHALDPIRKKLDPIISEMDEISESRKADRREALKAKWAIIVAVILAFGSLLWSLVVK